MYIILKESTRVFLKPNLKGFISNLLIISGATFFLFNSAYAGGFQSFEFGTPTLGRAAVGQSVVEDASASYLNSAAMSQIECSEVMLGSELVITKSRFRPSSLNTFSGNEGGNAGMILPGLGIFSVFSVSPDLKLGLSLASPFAGGLNYNNGWVGRYFVQTTSLLTLDLNPSFSYAINDWLSFGAGAIIEYAKLNQTIGIPALSSTLLLDGQADLRLQHYAPGFNLGLLFTPSCDTKIGIAYRSHINHTLKGNTTFLNLGFTPISSAVLKLPQGIIASLSQNITKDLTALAELGWTNWQVFKSTIVTIQNITLTIPRKWKDTYRFGLGLQQKLNSHFLLQLGASYDTSPTNSVDRLPDLPMDKQLRLGTGIIYTSCDAVTLSLNYEYLKFGKAKIHKVTRLGTLSGHYPKNFGHFLGLSINFKL